MQILNSLVPIFAVIGLGIVLRRQNFLTRDTTQGFNRFAYYFALPVFLFYKLGGAPSGANNAEWFLVTLLSASAVTLVAGWLASGWTGTRFGSRGAMIQACFRGNLAFMGLPLIMFTTYDLPPEQKAQLESAVLLTIAPVVIFYNAASVAALAIYNEQSERNFSWKTVGFNFIFNPLLIACVLGLAVQKIGWEIPTALGRTCEVLGASAFPLALLGIGSQLASISVAGHIGESLLASFFKCVFCPMVGWLVGRWAGLSGIDLQVILILCAVPTAVSSYVLADQMKGDGALAASSVVIGTAVSLFTLSVLLAIPF
jgi:predicted permease